MTFTQSIRHVLSNYVTFKGRASRSELWWFVLFVSIVSILASILGGIIAGAGLVTIGTLISILPSLALFLPNIAVGTRRLHDTNRTGWWQLIIFLPILGSIILLVFFLLRGTDGHNRFGPAQVPGLLQSDLKTIS